MIRKYEVTRYFDDMNLVCLGKSHKYYDYVLEELISKMENKIGRPLFVDEYRSNLKFVMDAPFYDGFCSACKMSGYDSPPMYRGIPCLQYARSYMDMSNTRSPGGIVKLVYKMPEVNLGLDRGHGFQKVPHIDHVKFNDPATIVFWKDGTKTVVKHDGKGRKDKRQAILYAFIRKIYGEGRPYHDILNEIEEAVK